MGIYISFRWLKGDIYRVKDTMFTAKRALGSGVLAEITAKETLEACISNSKGARNGFDMERDWRLSRGESLLFGLI